MVSHESTGAPGGQTSGTHCGTQGFYCGDRRSLGRDKVRDWQLWPPTHRAKSRSMNGAQFHPQWVGNAGAELEINKVAYSTKRGRGLAPDGLGSLLPRSWAKVDGWAICLAAGFPPRSPNARDRGHPASAFTQWWKAAPCWEDFRPGWVANQSRWRRMSFRSMPARSWVKPLRTTTRWRTMSPRLAGMR